MRPGVSHFMTRLAILIDGGHLRVLVRKSGHEYNPDYIEQIARTCVLPDESLLRVLYYDCAPYRGEVPKPVSNERHEFTGSDRWLQVLAEKDLFAVRRGDLKFRGWTPKRRPLDREALTDEDFKPNFEQKGVDMRIGLDVATFSNTRAVDRIALLTNDTDCIPAMKHARKAGLQVALVTFPGQKCASGLLWHSDFERKTIWP